jgi:hypothetical protein
VGTFLQDGKLMRKMIMCSAPPQGYHDPKAAINRALAYNSENRTIPDSEISGKKIREVLWSNTALVFELDDERKTKPRRSSYLTAACERVMVVRYGSQTKNTPGGLGK